jgi:glycosyltransferase involved in cell wall biosynthesis
MKLSIIIPACNEEKRIGGMLDRYLPYFASIYRENVEFIVVVNGSTDRTADIVKSYTAKFPCLRYIVEPEPIGKGGAIKVGFREAQGEIVGFVDADGSTPPEAFQELVEYVGEADVVIASRWLKGAKVFPHQPFLRRLASRVFNLLTRLMFGMKLTDTQCGAKVMKKEASDSVVQELGITRWAFDVDLLFLLSKKGFKILEIPTVWSDVAGSKLNTLQAAPEMFVALVRLRLIYSPFKFMVKLYDKYIGAFLHPPGVEPDRLLRHGFLLFASGEGANLCNLIFQLAMVRLLTNADYAVMSSMLAFVAVVTLPLTAVGTAVSFFTARLFSVRAFTAIKGFVSNAAKQLTPLFLLVVFVLFLDPLLGINYFKLKSVTPFVLAVISILLSAYLPFTGGILTGIQAFGWIAGINVSVAFLRVVFAVIIALIGAGATGVLCVHAFSLLLILSLQLLAVQKSMNMTGIQQSPPATLEVYSYLLQYLPMLFAFVILMNSDVLFVKRYFDEEIAGVFAKISMVAHMGIAFATPFGGAMFPKIASKEKITYSVWKTFLKGVTVVTIMQLCVMVICLVFPELILKLLAGLAGGENSKLLRIMTVALSPLPILNIVINFQTALQRFHAVPLLVLTAAGYIGGVIVWHSTVFQIAWILMAVSFCALFISILTLPWREIRDVIKTYHARMEQP